jgi:tetratricopeptide (TPR) repeat protein
MPNLTIALMMVAAVILSSFQMPRLVAKALVNSAYIQWTTNAWVAYDPTMTEGPCPSVWLSRWPALPIEIKNRVQRQVSSALQSAPNEASAYRMLGLIFASDRQYEEAVSAFRKAISIHQSHSLYHRDLANVLFLTGDVQEPAHHWKTSGIAPLFIYRGRLLLWSDAECSTQWLEMAAQVDPSNVEVYSLQMALFGSLGRWDEGIQAYEAFQSASIGSIPGYQIAAGLYLFGKKDPVAAYRVYRKVLPLTNNDMRDRLSQLNGEWEFLSDLSRSVPEQLQADLVNGMPWVFYQYYHLTAGLWGGNLLEYYPALMLMGSTSEMLGDSRRAAKYYGQLIQYAPGSGALHFLLGRQYEAQCMTDEALQEYRVALTLAPSARDVQEHIESLTVTRSRCGQRGETDEVVR